MDNSMREDMFLVINAMLARVRDELKIEIKVELEEELSSVLENYISQVVDRMLTERFGQKFGFQETDGAERENLKPPCARWGQDPRF